MRYLFFVLAALAVAGLTRADDHSACAVELQEGEQMHSKVAGKAFKCLVANGTHIERSLNTSQPTHAIFQVYCQEKPIYLACLSDVTLQSRTCQNETRHQIFLVLKHLLDNVLENGCNDHDLADQLFSGIFFSDVDEGPVSECLEDLVARIKLVFENDAFDIPMKIFFLFKDFHTLRECVHDSVTGDVEYKTRIVNFFNGIIEKMQCINRADDTSVPCETIQEHSFCPIRRQEEDIKQMDDLILEQMAMCIDDMEPDVVDFDAIKDLEGYRTFSKHLCKKLRNTLTCVNQGFVLSELCLNSTEHRALKTAVGLIMNAVESGCVLNGEPLAIVTHSVLREDNSSKGHPNAARECLQVIKANLLSVQEEDMHVKTRVLHRELGTFKNCLVRKLHGDNMAVFHADVMLNGMIRKMWCFDPKSKTNVLCEKMQPTPERTECPYVLDHPSGRLALFENLARNCRHVNQLDYTHIEELRDLGEFEDFFRHYCEDHKRVSACLIDLSVDGKVCLPTPEHDMLPPIINLLRNSLTFGCERQGQALASAVYGMRKYSEVLRPCQDATKDRFNNIIASTGNTTTITVDTFRAMTDYIKCYTDNVPDEGQFKADSLSFFGIMLKKVECVNNEGILVHCETIVNDVHTD